MKKTTFLFILCAIFLAVSTLLAGDFKIYPGAKFDEKLTKDATEMQKTAPGGTLWTVAIYTTKDHFEQVYAFYKGTGNEYNMPSSPKSLKLPSGTELKTAYFLFGGAKDIESAKSWIKVQNPLISHKKVVILTPGTKKQDTGEVPGITTIMHMLHR